MHLVTSALLHVRSIAVKLIHGRGGEGEVGHLILCVWYSGFHNVKHVWLHYNLLNTNFCGFFVC